MNTKEPLRDEACTAGAGASTLRWYRKRPARVLLGAASTVLMSIALAACGGGGSSGTADPTQPAAQAPSAPQTQAPEPKLYKVGGSVAGLRGTPVVLQNNAGNDLSIGADGNFSFTTALTSGSAFAVTVKTQPSSPTQLCTVNGGAGTVGTSDIGTVAVVCATQTFTVGGTVAGLKGTGLVLQNNAGDDLVLDTNGRFTFASPVASLANYAVSVKTQPTGPEQTCTVSKATGKVTSAAVDNVEVVCAPDSYTVSGTVSGLPSGGLTGVSLQNNGTDSVYVRFDGTFTFPARIANGASYAVTVSSQPNNPVQVCTVNNGSGVMGGANVVNVVVSCATQSFTVGGTLSGLDGVGLVLQNNAGDDLAISENGRFVFSTPVASGSTYNVTVKTQPKMLDQKCDVSPSTGSVWNANVGGLSVTCTTPSAVAAYVGMAPDIASGQPIGVLPKMVQMTGDLSASYSPFGMTTTGTKSVALDPQGKYVYALDDTSIYRFTIANPVGVGLVGTATTPVPDLGASTLVMDPLGRYLVVLNPVAARAYLYAIDPVSANLTLINWVTSAAVAAAFDPSGRVLYTAQPSGTINGYMLVSGTIGSAGSATVTGPANSVAFDPQGKFLYVGTAAALWTFELNPDGSLGAGVQYVADNPRQMAFHPAGKFLYTAEGSNADQPARIVARSLNQTTGTPTFVDLDVSLATMGLKGMVVDPTGRFLHVISSDMQETYSIDPASGRLTVLSSSSFPAPGATSIALKK